MHSMKRIRLIVAIFSTAALVALAAAPARLSGGGVCGGGATASASGRTLSGAVGGLGLPASAGAVSQGGGLRLEVGPIPALHPPKPKPTPNAADPVWLGIEPPTPATKPR